MWQEPIFDRTNTDTRTARTGQSQIENHKGALNYQDLNRVEENFQYVVQHLFDNAIIIPHMLRNFTETVLEYVTKETSLLPEGYTQAEYIQSSGTQYLDTGVHATNKTKVEIKVDATNAHFFMATPNSNARYGLYALTTKKVDVAMKSAYMTVGSDVSYPAVLVLENGKLTANGTAFEFTPQGSFTSSTTLPLFAEGTATSGGKVYYCKIWENDTLIRDYVPCTNASGTAGLYDLVNNEFYANVGSGEFYACVKRNLPSGYTQVEYLGSDGTQVIKTGLFPTQDYSLEVAYKTTSGNPNSGLVGCETAWGTNGFSLYHLAAQYGNSTKTFTSNDGEVHKLSLDRGVLKLDGVQIWTASGTFTVAYEMYIFATNRSGSTNQPFIGEILYAKVYNAGTLICDYVPCKNADGVAGLYDVIGGKFYDNDGTGSFTTGPEIENKPEYVHELVEVRTTYTDWQEQNIPWKSEIDRIRQNFNNLTNLFLHSLNLPIFEFDDYLMYSEVNDWERISLTGKTMVENMIKEYRRCGIEESGGDILL